MTPESRPPKTFTTEGMIAWTTENPPHVPDATRLPNCVTGWKEMSESDLFEDGMQLLVAVPIVYEYGKDGWHYSYEVVTIHCDEHYFDVEDANGDPWGWDMTDVDFYVVLKK